MEARILASLKPLKASYAPDRSREPRSTFGCRTGNERRCDGTYDAVRQTSTNRPCGYGSRSSRPSGQRRPVFRGNVGNRSNLFGGPQNFETGNTGSGHQRLMGEGSALCAAPNLFREAGDAPPLSTDATPTSTIWSPCEAGSGESTGNRGSETGHDSRRTGRTDLAWPFAVSGGIGPVTIAQAFAATRAGSVRCVAMFVQSRPVGRHQGPGQARRQRVWCPA